MGEGNERGMRERQFICFSPRVKACNVIVSYLSSFSRGEGEWKRDSTTFNEQRIKNDIVVREILQLKNRRTKHNASHKLFLSLSPFTFQKKNV